MSAHAFPFRLAVPGDWTRFVADVGGTTYRIERTAMRAKKARSGADRVVSLEWVAMVEGRRIGAYDQLKKAKLAVVAHAMSRRAA